MNYKFNRDVIPLPLHLSTVCVLGAFCLLCTKSDICFVLITFYEYKCWIEESHMILCGLLFEVIHFGQSVNN